MTRIKLTAGGSKFVSECLRLDCPSCKNTLLLHPSRWPNHIEECCNSLSTIELSFFYSQATGLVKELIGKKLISHHNSTEN